MASRMGFLARRIAAPKAFLPVRGGDGGPVELAKTVSEPLAEEDELIWQDGTANPETCIDKDNLTVWQGIGSLAAGMSIFGLVYLGCAIYDKPSKMPYRPREYPYNNLKEESGVAWQG